LHKFQCPANSGNVSDNFKMTGYAPLRPLIGRSNHDRSLIPLSTNPAENAANCEDYDGNTDEEK
jgi:hypothetical protein